MVLNHHPHSHVVAHDQLNTPPQLFRTSWCPGFEFRGGIALRGPHGTSLSYIRLGALHGPVCPDFGFRGARTQGVRLVDWLRERLHQEVPRHGPDGLRLRWLDRQPPGRPPGCSETVPSLAVFHLRPPSCSCSCSSRYSCSSCCSQGGLPVIEFGDDGRGGGGEDEWDSPDTPPAAVAGGESWPTTAATTMDNPYCSCKLTRVRSRCEQ